MKAMARVPKPRHGKSGGKEGTTAAEALHYPCFAVLQSRRRNGLWSSGVWTNSEDVSDFFFFFTLLSHQGSPILHIDRTNSQKTDTLTGTLQNTDSNIPPGFLSLFQGLDLIFRF